MLQTRARFIGEPLVGLAKCKGRRREKRRTARTQASAPVSQTHLIGGAHLNLSIAQLVHICMQQRAHLTGHSTESTISRMLRGSRSAKCENSANCWQQRRSHMRTAGSRTPTLAGVTCQTISRRASAVFWFRCHCHPEFCKISSSN